MGVDELDPLPDESTLLILSNNPSKDAQDEHRIAEANKLKTNRFFIAIPHLSNHYTAYPKKMQAIRLSNATF
ncbi:hypothetical protein AGMMS49942_08450 [Spirochaetia bacterium]|nr:hypothetical protein AGMMS49942_08450 [Spirochaetia bacterium]